MKINGKEVKTNGCFSYEGCHKIYVCEDEHDERESRELGYAILPIAELPDVWDKSCPLRFIRNCKLDVVYAGQGDDAKFEY